MGDKIMGAGLLYIRPIFLRVEFDCMSQSFVMFFMGAWVKSVWIQYPMGTMLSAHVIAKRSPECHFNFFKSSCAMSP